MAEREDNEGRGNALQGVAVTPVMGGMVQDTEIVNQPQGTYRYALNMVRESHLPKHIAICNEQSNEKFLAVEQTESHMMLNEYIIGCIDVGDEKFVLFTVSYYEPAQTPYMSHDPVSRIYIYDSKTGYISAGDMIVDDTNSAPYDKLRFNEHHQIEGLYRLRNGCERHVYWTDNLNVPRTMNIDRPEKYVDAAKNPVASKFNLIKTYSRIPYFERIDKNGDARFGVEVLDGGKLMPGGYNVTVRLIDADRNATEWITVTNTIIVSNESPANTEYQKMRGSTSKQSEWQKFGDSGKMIRVSVKGDSIDTNYEYVQFGLIERNSGTGEDMQVVLSQPVMISADVPNYYTYTFTGDAGYGTDTVESVDVNTMVVGKAKTITDNNSRLLLGNIEGKNVDWCLLQKYASKIESKCVVKHITLDNIDDKDCVASAIYNNEDVGYMPGEVYSFGIVYVFDDGSVSPVYHIPGPNPDYAEPIIFPNDPVVGESEYPMQSKTCADIAYTENNSCGNDSYWGVDNIGKQLAGKNVRHHKFPTRTELDIPLVVKETVDPAEIFKTKTNNYVLFLHAKGKFVDKVYKRNYDSFTINVRLAFSYGTPNVWYKDVPVVIKCDDWDDAARGNKCEWDFNGNKTRFIDGNNGFFAIKLGVFEEKPVIYSLSERPQTYIRSEGDKGTRYGWCTSGGHIKCRYKTDNNEWVNDDGTPLYPKEDGSDLSSWFWIYDKNHINHQKNLETYNNHNLFWFSWTQSDYPDGWFNVSVVNWFSEDFYIKSLSPLVKEYFDGVDNEDPRGVNYCHIIHNTKDFNISGKPNRYTVPILGIKFYGIQMPSLEDTNGNRIVGYYIVRNKRDDENKTILDSAVTLPIRTDSQNSNNVRFLSYNNIKIGNSPVNENNRAFINPEHLFLKKKYNNFEFVVDGRMTQDTSFDYTENGSVNHSVNGVIHSYDNLVCSHSSSMTNTEEFSSADTDFIFEDIQPGTSYDKSVNNKKDEDKDGFDLFTIIKELNVKYVVSQQKTIKANNISYLSPLDSMITDDNKILYNISSDNSIGIMSGGFNLSDNDKYRWEYGYLYRDVRNPYGNFSSMPYYKDSKNIIYATNSEDTVTNSGAIFSGDVYVSPMRYVNSVFYDNKIKRRRRKKALWRIIGGALGSVASIVAGVYAGPAFGIAGLTASISLLTSGINISKANKVYNKLYNSGLKKTVDDNDYYEIFTKASQFDDQIQWAVEVVNSMWFESTINLFWRNTLTADYPKPLDPLTHWNTDDYVRYMRDKFLVQDSESANGLLYIGYAKSEFYDYNYDYLSKTNHKVYHALPDTYDCCLKCNEKFTHRIIYSEKSFIEERTDNYRKFLPMNYKDVEGIKGDITALVSHNNDVIVLCREGSWGLILNTQPMVIGGIVSYLGTGDMFTVSPKPYVMACQHQFSIQKINGAVMFVDVFNKCVWMYSSKQNSYGTYVASPEDIAQLGMRRFLFDELGIDEREYNDNPASIIGHGYVIGYDPKLQRIVVTKKDTRPENWRTDDIIEANGQFYNKNQIDDRIQDFASSHGNDMYDPDTNPHGWQYYYTDNGNALVWFRRQLTKSINGTIGIWNSHTNGINVIDAIYYRIRYAYEYLDEHGEKVTYYMDYNDVVGYGLNVIGNANLKFRNGNDEYYVAASLDPNVYTANNPSADANGYVEWPDSNLYEYGYSMDYSALYFDKRIINVKMDVNKDENDSCHYPLYYDFTLYVDFYETAGGGFVDIEAEYYKCNNGTWTKITDTNELLALDVKCKIQYNDENSNRRDIVFPIDVYDEFGHITTDKDWKTSVNTYDKSNMGFIVKNVLASNESFEVIYNTPMQPSIEYYDNKYTFKFYLTDSCGGDPIPYVKCRFQLILNFATDGTIPYMNYFDNPMYVSFGGTQYQITLTSDNIPNPDGSMTFRSNIIEVDRNFFFGVDWNSWNDWHIFSSLYNVIDVAGGYAKYPFDEPSFVEFTVNAQAEMSLPESLMMTGNFQLQCIPDSDSGFDTNPYSGEIDYYEYDTIPLVPMSEIGFVNYGWTLSFHIPDKQWVSFHSYIPNMYFNNSEHMFTVADKSIWRHGVEGDFCRFNGTNRDCTIEYVSVENNGLVVKVWDDISLMADIIKFGQNGPYKITDKFFDKLLVWNTRQMSGDIDLTAKDSRNGAGYLVTQQTDVFADCNEGVWSINGFRDNVVDYQKPMFIVDKDALQHDWFVDKKVNTDAIVDTVTGNTKQWFNSERMRDRFMCVRLTKTADNDLNKQDVKYIVYLTEDEVTRSER